MSHKTALQTTQNVDGSHPIHSILLNALQDPSTPSEVRAIILDLQDLPPHDALLEARLFAKALNSGETAVAPAIRRRAMRQAYRDWHTDLSCTHRRRSAEKLVGITTAWADAALDAEIRRDV